MQYQVRDQIATFKLDNPPVNGLSHALRSAIADAVQRANADPGVQALILIGSARAFSAGAEIREFSSPAAVRAEPTLPSLIEIVEESAKPVIGAINGLCLGGGLELAMGCHYRLALAGTRVGLPEVKLGILPGAGGTQRLPRLVGLEAALNLAVSGKIVPAEMFKATPLFDAFVSDGLEEAAQALARKAIASSSPLPRVRDRRVSHENADGYLEFARNAVRQASGVFPAPMKCLEAVAASLTVDFDAGLSLENRFFRELVVTPESEALRHVFFGERRAAKIPDIADNTPLRPIRSAGVIGAGTMGTGIAIAFADAGIPVTLLEASPDKLEKGLAAIRKTYAGAVTKGRSSTKQSEERINRITGSLDYQPLSEVDLIIEAVFEDSAVKRQVFERLDQVAKPGAILATNTSMLDIDKIAAATRRPQDVVGLHFFSPAHVMRLLEIVRGAQTAQDVLATVMRLAKSLGKLAVVACNCDGFIGNRMIEQYLRQAGFLLDEGALPAQVDRALEAWGMAMGPFKMSDLAGGDLSREIRQRRLSEQPDWRYSKIADELYERGRFGQKTSAGWYRYPQGSRVALPDPEIDQLVIAHSAQIGLTRRAISDREIVERCIYALINEGARLLEEGVAAAASDIDMVYLHGYGFPVHRGGPMFYADSLGLYRIVRRMQQFAKNPYGDPEFWIPSPLLAQLAASGGRFNSMEGQAHE